MNTRMTYILLFFLAFAGCQDNSTPAPSGAAGTAAVNEAALSDDAYGDLVRRSYQYVTMYNVNNKFALSQGGWNTCNASTSLKDHTMQDIARPNNDTLYTGCMLDLTQDAMIINVPAFDSAYASLMVTAYDHFVNIPLTSRRDDFDKPKTMLFYTKRTKGYDGAPVEGVDIIFEASGDFISAVFRVMPHATEPERFQRIIAQKQSVRPVSLTKFLGGEETPYVQPEFPQVGRTNADTFGTNLLEVMQFVINHTTFDADDPNDQALLALYAPLGIAPGKTFDPAASSNFDGARAQAVAENIQKEWLAKIMDPAIGKEFQPRMFQPKGQTDLETVLAVSVFGPIGLPQEEALYPSIATADGEPMNALHDYVIRMDADEMPPAGAFWSLTLYDRDNGFFIPNDRKKYSVGLNGGMKLDDSGGISIYIAAEKPEGVPDENWLPIQREDLALTPTMRLYEPDLEKYAVWVPPAAERIN